VISLWLGLQPPEKHRHSGIGMHTPASVHFGTAEQIRAQRQVTLNRAYAKHPERFTRRPRPPKPPDNAWTNQPVDSHNQPCKHNLSHLTGSHSTAQSGRRVVPHG
jgi:hypothetical protein